MRRRRQWPPRLTEHVFAFPFTTWVEVTGERLEELRTEAAAIGHVTDAVECEAMHVATQRREWITAMRFADGRVV